MSRRKRRRIGLRNMGIITFRIENPYNILRQITNLPQLSGPYKDNKFIYYCLSFGLHPLFVINPFAYRVALGGEAWHESHLRAGFALRRELLWGEVVGTLIVLDAAATFIAAAKGEDCKEKNGEIEQFSFHIDGVDVCMGWDYLRKSTICCSSMLR